MTTVTKLDQNIEKAEEYLNKTVGTPYSWWTGGKVPDGAPAWAKNGRPPEPADVRGTSCFCAGVANLARRVVGLEIPTLGSPDFDGGVVAYFGATGSAPPSFPRQGYFERHGKLRRFNLEEARRPWTLIGRKYRNVSDQGHVAIVLPGGKVLQSYDAGGGRPGVNKDATLERSHDGGYYEVMVRAEDWLLPFGAEREEPPRERPERERPEEHERPEPERVVLFTARQLSEISENSNLPTLERYRNALIPEMQKAGITTHLRMAAFLANVAQETDRLQTLEEYGDESYFRSFLGDQWRYHGRGFLMNTWRDAYARLSNILDANLVDNPDLLARPELAAKAATWFWSQHNLNAYADRAEFKKVCAIINTGSPNGEPNGLADRLHFYDRAKRVLSSGARAPDSSLERNGFNRDGLPYINIAAVGQADETAAFVLATEIRRAGIGVTVTNGRDSVYALARKMRGEDLGYRQLWIFGEPALDACDEYRELANWPISPKTDYYNLAGKDFTGTCRRAAELADEKAKKGVGQRFLEEMAESTSKKSPLPTPAPARDEEQEDGRKREGEEYRRRSEEKTEKDQDYPEEEARSKGGEEERRGGRYHEPDGSEPVERHAGEDLRDTDLEEIGREVLRLIRSYTGQSKSPRGESDAHNEKEGD